MKSAINVRTDKFYTKPEIAKECIDAIQKHIIDWEQYLWLEPSCGTGSFSNNITSVEMIAIDNDPDISADITMNFLDYLYNKKNNKKVLLFGNPPFGRQGALAKSFIRHGAKFADVIAFILPLSFIKPSMYSAFPGQFHNIYEHILPKDSYIHNNAEWSVPTVFQIWKVSDIIRPALIKIEPKGYKYTYETCNIIIRRVGSKAGQCYTNDKKSKYSKSSHYFIEIEDSITDNLESIITNINRYVFPDNTTGPRSISKQELNAVLNKIIDEL